MVHSEDKQPGLLATIGELAFLLLIVFLIRTVGFGLYQVPTGSMETTMLVGERFFADKFSYFFRGPERGEVIAINEPPAFYKYSENPFMYLFQQYVWGPANWTKRIIGKPGDTVRGAIEDGKPVVYLNGKKSDEPYLNKYPLIYSFKEDPEQLYKKVEQEIKNLVYGRTIDPSVINKLVQKRLAVYTIQKSYDPDYSFEQQPFYRMKEIRVIRDAQNNPELLKPGTPHPSANPTAAAAAIEQKENYWDSSDEFYVELGPDEYWLMGDNRLGSKDCRGFGPVKRSFIHGRILFRIWSIDSDESWWFVDLLMHPIDFWSRVRWNRFFQWIY